MAIVSFGERFNSLLAACCKVLVEKGCGAADVFVRKVGGL
jgi:hypothetical protein